jgi:hypothetical protein
LYLGRNTIDSALVPGGPRATVLAAGGDLYLVSHGALQEGASLGEGEVVRTSAGGRAMLQLADGSRVEMNQRTELSLHAAWSGQTIRLNRGDIIVEAARQRRGQLRVVTRDSMVSVKGTVFAVSAGTAGSLVSVVEGAVQVSQPGANKVITPGQQSATSAALERVDVRQAIAWSQEKEKYFALLAEFIGIEKQLHQMSTPAPRTEAKLLKYIPTGTHVYVAIPNLSGAIRQAMSLLDQRARSSPVLDEWWNSEHGKELRKTFDNVQAVAPLLGEEVVLVLGTQAGSNDPRSNKVPLLLAQVQPGRTDALKQALDRIAAETKGGLPYRLSQDLLLISENAATLSAVAAQLGGSASSPFAAEIAQRYRKGVSWLLGLDVAAFDPDAKENEGRLLGLGNMRYLFFEQRSSGGRDENEATLSFQGARTGIASWLATPGSSGSGEYISPEAVFVLSASTRNARQAFDEMLAILGQQGNVIEEMREFEAETGVSIGNDIASSLGTDFTIAVERPSLPVPGWVAAYEVLRPTVLDDTVRRLVEVFNRKVDAGQVHPSQAGHRLTLTQETVSGRPWNVLKPATGTLALYWTYDRGYLVASTDRALAVRAITLRDTGSSLVRSLRFQERFPATSGLHHSGFLWLNTSGVLADLANLVDSPAIKNLMGSRDPILVVMDGEMERIHAASRTRLTSLILDVMLAGGAVHEGANPPHTTRKELKSRTM